jgi:hypothetical protein
MRTFGSLSPLFLPARGSVSSRLMLADRKGNGFLRMRGLTAKRFGFGLAMYHLELWDQNGRIMRRAEHNWPCAIAKTGFSTQPEAMAILMRRTLTVTSAPSFKKLLSNRDLSETGENRPGSVINLLVLRRGIVERGDFALIKAGARQGGQPMGEDACRHGHDYRELNGGFAGQMHFLL